MIRVTALLYALFGLALAADLTWYNDVGYGACGTQIDPNTQMLAAISHLRWTTANPNNDPLCKLCVTVSYNGKK